VPLSIIGITILFILYTYGITENPPGFYQDESAFAYNAYMLAKTGHSEFGVHWPLFLQNFTWPFTVYCNPVCIYLLAIFNLVFPPSIWLARLLSSVAGFETAMLLGLLAFRISRKVPIGVIVGLTALITPWLFEVDRLFFDSSFYPLALTLFLLALYQAHMKERWSWFNVAALVATLGLLTYTYTIGRMLAGLLALGLLFFAVNKGRLFDVIKVWVGYGIVLIPLAVFNLRHPGALTSRFWGLSYLRTEKTFQGIVLRFITRYFQDLSFTRLLTTGDINPRHHVPGATGSLLAAPFILALLGVIIIFWRHRRDPWWRFIILGLLAAVVPGALTVDAFHTGRMIACPIFLLVLTIPALEWLIQDGNENSHQIESGAEDAAELIKGDTTASPRRAVLIILLFATIMQAAYFQTVFWREGPKRAVVLDATYRNVYDVAVAMPARPIYLADGQFGPAYIHALWYATLEGRSTSEFVHLDYRVKAPPGSLVLSSEDNCANCEVVLTSGQYSLYRQN
jgi:4-amino-4-deoxy-L-arabinose transferase-like glycosyltransferase